MLFCVEFGLLFEGFFADDFCIGYWCIILDIIE